MGEPAAGTEFRAQVDDLLRQAQALSGMWAGLTPAERQDLEAEVVAALEEARQALDDFSEDLESTEWQ